MSLLPSVAGGQFKGPRTILFSPLRKNAGENRCDCKGHALPVNTVSGVEDLVF